MKHVFTFLILLASLARLQAQAPITQTFNYTHRIETFTVPAGVTSLTITAKGAQGGAAGIYAPGKGAIITGTVQVTPGQQLSILVGEQPIPPTFTAGGGGGSFVVTGSNPVVPLIIAGGGGGGGGSTVSGSANYDSSDKDGQAGNDGAKGTGPTNTTGVGGTNGNGGGAGSGRFGASGGGGLFGNGSASNFYQGGQSFVNGGEGGAAGRQGDFGGFGGGGAGVNVIDPPNGYSAGGGGGGYSGGGASSDIIGTGSGVGGGGGSYNADPNGTNTRGANSGFGQVIISYAPPCTNPTPTLTSSGTLTCSQTSVTLTAGGGATGATYRFSTQTAPTSSSTISVSASGPYSVTVTNPGGCSAVANTTIESNTAPPAATLNNSGPLSDNQTVTLTAGGGGIYRFSQGATQQNPPTGNTATVTSPGVYQVTVTGSNGCTATASTTVTGAANQTICRNGTAVVTVVASGNPVKYEWYRSSTSTARLNEQPGFQRGTSTASLTVINQQTTYAYYVRVTDANGTSVVYGPFKVTVNTSCNANARLSGEEVSLQITVLGNPLQGDQLRATIQGAAGRTLNVQLLDLSGKPIRQQAWQQAESDQMVEWNLTGQSSGVYLLQAVSSLDGNGPAQRQSVKVIKP